MANIDCSSITSDRERYKKQHTRRHTHTHFTTTNTGIARFATQVYCPPVCSLSGDDDNVISTHRKQLCVNYHRIFSSVIS